MGDSDRVLTYCQLIVEIRRLCAQRQTGWLFITTSDNHSVRFGLQNGTIVALIFRNQTGLEALASIQRVLKGSLSFSSGPPNPKPQAGLPPTAELLALLQSAATDHADEADTGPGLLDETMAGSRAIIEAELVEYLGPMARLVIDEHVPAASNLTDLIDSLAREISDPAKSASFKERVRERLASSVSGKNAR
jgi:hypothetical protein